MISSSPLPLFQDLCIDWDELLSEPSLTRMLRIANKQSKTPEALLKTEPLKYDPETIEPATECPLYFGMFVEWLSYHFLNQYGRRWNIINTRMITSVFNDEKDVGIDGEATTPMDGLKRRMKNQPELHPGAPVFIQVKGSLNPTKTYKPSDGSRLGNFFAAAQHAAKKRKVSYKARYLVIHTGSGLNSWFSNFADFEEINYRDMAEMIDGNHAFLNVLRSCAGLPVVDIPTCAEDC